MGHPLHALARLAHAVVEDGGRPVPAAPGLEVLAHLGGVGALPLAVEPDDAGVVELEDLADLGLEVLLDEAGHVGRPLGDVVVLAAGRVPRVMPVHNGMVEAEADAVPQAGLLEGLQEVLPPGRRGHVMVGDLGVPEAEAVVVLGGDDQVVHPGLLGGLHPGVGVELHRVEAVAGRQVAREGQLVAGRLDDPLPGAAHPLAVHVPRPLAVEAPVDEHAEAGVVEPAHPGLLALRRLGGSPGHPGVAVGVDRGGGDLRPRGAGQHGGQGEQDAGQGGGLG